MSVLSCPVLSCRCDTTQRLNKLQQTQRNATQRNATQRNATQRNATQRNGNRKHQQLEDPQIQIIKCALRTRRTLG